MVGGCEWVSSSGVAGVLSSIARSSFAFRCQSQALSSQRFGTLLLAGTAPQNAIGGKLDDQQPTSHQSIHLLTSRIAHVLLGLRSDTCSDRAFDFSDMCMEGTC